MFLGIHSIYTPVYLPLCEYGQNQPPCTDVGLLLNMARTCSFHSLVWAILRSNPPSLHVGWFFKIYPSGALGVYFPIYTPRSIYRSVYLIVSMTFLLQFQELRKFLVLGFETGTLKAGLTIIRTTHTAINLHFWRQRRESIRWFSKCFAN